MTETVDTGEKDENGKAKMSTKMASGALERVDAHTVRFHLNRPELSLPESMADYPALIAHRELRRWRLVQECDRDRRVLT